MANNHRSPQTLRKELSISVDYREKITGIVDLLNSRGFTVRVKKLPFCDYIIDNEIGIERKTAKDFIVSIMDGRLFTQAALMKRRLPRPIFILEGNPLETAMNMNDAAIRGAMISIQVIWHIPMIHSRSLIDTCQLITWMGQQHANLSDGTLPRSGYRPKRKLSKQLYILQGLPNVGPTLSKKLLYHFQSVRKVMTANETELLKVKGIGKKKAMLIKKVLD
jgi:DNA excision repair protein ERCC-4